MNFTALFLLRKRLNSTIKYIFIDIHPRLLYNIDITITQYTNKNCNILIYDNNGSDHVEKIMNLEKKIIQLKLEKRELILAGKSTSKIDDEIDNIKNELDKLSEIVK